MSAERAKAVADMMDFIFKAAREHEIDESENLRLIAEHYVDAEAAKDVLRCKGYGVTGMPLLQTVELVAGADDYYDKG